MKTKALVALLCAAIAGVAFASRADADITASKYVKVYKGPEGFKLTLVRLMPLTEGTALIKFTGIEHPLDGQVLLYSVDERDTKATSYSTWYRGARWFPLRRDQRRWGGTGYRFTPSGTKWVSLYYSKKDSKKADGAALLSEYRKQLKSGKVAKHQGLKAKVRHKLVRRELSAMAGYYKGDCMFKPEVEVVWSTVKDEQRYLTDVTMACSRVIQAMAQLCRDWSSSDVKARVQRIQCRFGKKLDARLASRKLTVTIPLGAEGLNKRVMALIKR